MAFPHVELENGHMAGSADREEEQEDSADRDVDADSWKSADGCSLWGVRRPHRLLQDNVSMVST